MKSRLLYVLTLLLAAAPFALPGRAATYQNPLSTLTDPNADADPRLLTGLDGKFYLYYPQGSYIAVFKSSDLINWTAPLGTGSANHVLRSSDITTPNTGFWAEGAFAINNTYYLYYTLVQSGTKSIGVATSSSPLGPFVDKGLVLTGSSSHAWRDPFVFKNPDTDKIFIYFSDGGNGLMGQELCSTVSPCGSNTKPTRVLTGSSAFTMITLSDPDYQAWEYIDLEHPTMFYAPNADSSHRFYLMYNGAGGALARYAIGYAYSASPRGPFHRATAAPSGTCGGGMNPMVCQYQTAGVYGPGSPNTVVDDAGTRWILYRFKTTNQESWSDRRTAVDVLFRNGLDQLVVTPTIHTNQTAPVF
ncbi:MAG: family 43 glycosylhydrolase [Acidobacteria bacterium]|nr:family 43 glycosylhydrolase [Acidobacteriota bacterium]